MKKRKQASPIMLVLVPALLAISGCTGDETQRDVYTRFEDCVADWGKPELCQKIAEAEAKEFAQNQGVTTGGGSSPIIFWGPSYYPGDRAVTFNGQTYEPKANRAMSRPFTVNSRSSSIARSSPGTARSTSVSRGGFGGGARAAGGGFGG